MDLFYGWLLILLHDTPSHQDGLATYLSAHSLNGMRPHYAYKYGL